MPETTNVAIHSMNMRNIDSSRHQVNRDKKDPSIDQTHKRLSSNLPPETPCSVDNTNDFSCSPYMARLSSTPEMSPSPVRSHSAPMTLTTPEPPQQDASEICCQFCGQDSTLRSNGKLYLIQSKTQPGLKICNACKSYEYRHGRLVKREHRQRYRMQRKDKRKLAARSQRKRFRNYPLLGDLSL
eukprot:UN33565